MKGVRHKHENRGMRQCPRVARGYCERQSSCDAGTSGNWTLSGAELCSAGCISGRLAGCVHARVGEVNSPEQETGRGGHRTNDGHIHCMTKARWSAPP